MKFLRILAGAAILGLGGFAATASAGDLDVHIGLGYPDAVYYETAPRYDYYPTQRVYHYDDRGPSYRYDDRRPVYNFYYRDRDRYDRHDHRHYDGRYRNDGRWRNDDRGRGHRDRDHHHHHGYRGRH